VFERACVTRFVRVFYKCMAETRIFFEVDYMQTSIITCKSRCLSTCEHSRVRAHTQTHTHTLSVRMFFL
jgi:hypothetical protein